MLFLPHSETVQATVPHQAEVAYTVPQRQVAKSSAAGYVDVNFEVLSVPVVSSVPVMRNKAGIALYLAVAHGLNKDTQSFSIVS